MIDQTTLWQPVDSAIGIVIGAVILVIMALIGVNMLLLLISGWILAYAGIFFLGFGGSRWTSDMAITYYKTILSIAAQLFTMVLVVGIGKSFVDQYYANMSAGLSLKELGVMLIVAVVLLAIVNKVPSLVGGLAMGGGTHALGGGFGAGAALGAAGMATAATAMGGAMIAGGAASAVGGGSALKAAFDSAQQNIANGIGGSSVGTGGGSAVSPLVNAGRLALGTGTELAKGIGEVVKNKASEVSAETFGAKVAQAIQNSTRPKQDLAQEKQDVGEKDAPEFSNDSLGAGKGTA